MLDVIKVFSPILLGIVLASCAMDDIEISNAPVSDLQEDEVSSPLGDGDDPAYCWNRCSLTESCSLPCKRPSGLWATCGDWHVCNDADGDGKLYHQDNCANIYNPDQIDCDGDGIGNVCDTSNANWQLVNTNLCGIHEMSTNETFINVQGLYRAHYRDISQCGNLDKYTSFAEIRQCIREPWMNALDCCFQNYHLSCYSFWNTYQC